MGSGAQSQRADRGLPGDGGPDIEIVEVVATDDDLQKGLGVSEALLRAHSDLNGVACVSATGGPTLAQVLQGPEFADRELTIVAFDDLQDVLDAIEAGIIYATMVQRPVQMGKLSISESYEILTQGLCAGVRVARHRRHRCYRGQPHHLHQVVSTAGRAEGAPSRHLAGMTPRHNCSRETTEETMNQTRFRFRRLSAVLGLVVVASMLLPSRSRSSWGAERNTRGRSRCERNYQRSVG